jgi:GNAT superfamily N-acetyltransferase
VYPDKAARIGTAARVPKITRPKAAADPTTTLYIEADRLDTGLGRRLIQTATRWLRTNPFSCATLWVLDSNDRARRFYEKAGWVRDGTMKVDDREGFSLHEVRYRTSFD